MSSHNPLPAALIERLFSRLIAIYGTQKIAPMWAGADLDEVKAVWAQDLGRFEPPTIGAGIQALIDSGSQWPPNLPEFVEICRKCAIERETTKPPALALPAPGGSYTDDETARANMARVKAMLAKIIRKVPT